MTLPDFSSGVELLNQGDGYGVIIGLGAFFALVILVAVNLQKRFLGEYTQHAEGFMVANRTVGVGLTASAVVSSWMWINETVFSVVQCFAYGIGVPAWFCSCLVYQIVLMALIGVQCKIKIPNAHTSLEIIKTRYGTLGHIVFMILNLINNIIGCSYMLITGSQLITGITNMHIVASTILIPAGVVVYTGIGGLRATFVTDFLHTTIALILIIVFTLGILCNERIGGITGLYDKLVALDPQPVIPGNYKGSVLTMKSQGTALFGLVLRFGNLALTVMDSAFYQKTFSAQPSSVVPGYLIASVAIFAVPWAIGTVVGLAAHVLQAQEGFPTYPGGFTENQINRGYVLPIVINGLMGRSATGGFLLLIFMTVTSTVSSSLIAVSSILSYDIYKTYIHPSATEKEVVRSSYVTVALYGAFIAGFTIMLSYVGANMNWVAYMSPIITSPGIFPMILAIFWKKQSLFAAVVSPIIGLGLGLFVWLYSAKRLYGTVNITTSGNQPPALYGVLTSLFVPLILTVILSLIRPADFDWSRFLQVKPVGNHGQSPGTKYVNSVQDTDNTPIEGIRSGKEGKVEPFNNDKFYTQATDEKAVPLEEGVYRRASMLGEVEQLGKLQQVRKGLLRTLGLSTYHEPYDIDHPYDTQTLLQLRRWRILCIVALVVSLLVTWVLWPMPLYRDYIFTRSFFRGWVGVAIFWQFLAFFLVVVYPLYDGRNSFVRIYRGLRKTKSVSRSPSAQTLD